MNQQIERTLTTSDLWNDMPQQIERTLRHQIGWMKCLQQIERTLTTSDLWNEMPQQIERTLTTSDRSEPHDDFTFFDELLRD